MAASDAGLKRRPRGHGRFGWGVDGTPLIQRGLAENPRLVSASAASEVASPSRSQHGGLGVGLPAGPLGTAFEAAAAVEEVEDVCPEVGDGLGVVGGLEGQPR